MAALTPVAPTPSPASPPGPPETMRAVVFAEPTTLDWSIVGDRKVVLVP